MFRWRPDADLARDLPATRRIMPFIMRTRNESAVYFEQKIDATKTLAFLDDLRARSGLRASLLHVVLWAIAQTIHERPRMNRFVAGGRIWVRRGIWLSFSAKKGMTDDHPVVVIKKRIDPAWSIEELIHNIEGGIAEGRSDRRSSTDKELGLLLRLPTFLLARVVALVRALDAFGLLPRFFYDGDPMFASAFIANLGSVKLEAAFHHLYEYGNIPIFAVIGRIQDEVVPGPDRTPVVRPTLTMRFTFDERIEDGLYCARALELFRRRVEDPVAHA